MTKSNDQNHSGGAVAPREGSNAALPSAARNLPQALGDPFRAGLKERLRLRDLPHFYADSVVRPAMMGALSSIENGTHMYLRGSCLGVGTSIFAVDFANSFNARTSEVGDPRRMGVVRVGQGSTSLGKFLDQLARYFKVPISTTELRFRGPTVLAQRVLAGARMAGISCLAIDHMSKASTPIRQLIEDLIYATDPRYDVRLEPDEFGLSDWKVGFLLIDHAPAEVIFREAPKVLEFLNGREVVLPPYKTVEEVCEALRQSEIGLEDCDPADGEDALFAQTLLEKTDGLPANIEPLLQVVDLVARHAGRERPDLPCLEAALQGWRQFVDVTEYREIGRPQTPFYAVMARRVERIKSSPPDLGGSGSMDRAGKPASLKEKRQARGMARREQAKMLRHDHGAV